MWEVHNTLYGLMRDDGEEEQRTVLTRTIARVICETWEQEMAGAEAPRSHD